MQRMGRRARIREGCAKEYELWHRRVWPEVLQALGEAGIRCYSIFRWGNELFSYYEVENLEAATRLLGENAACRRWQEALAPLMEARDPLAPWVEMEEVFFLE